VVHFSGKARKMNHIPSLCERSEQYLSSYEKKCVTKLNKKACQTNV
jgi:hypothetical protein